MRHNPEKREEQPQVEDLAPAEAAETDVDLDEIDRVLDEIDDILEENAVEFVENFQQRGGE